jgi:predicted TPR repeat methyltransferase
MARYSVIAGYASRFCKGPSLLDVGCGHGVLWHYIDHERIPKYTGIDLSATALADAKIPGGMAELIEADIDEYAFPVGTQFDCIVFNEVLSYPNHP